MATCTDTQDAHLKRVSSFSPGGCGGTGKSKAGLPLWASALPGPELECRGLTPAALMDPLHDPILQTRGRHPHARALSGRAHFRAKSERSKALVRSRSWK